MSVVFSMPGKIGDSLLQWPIPFWFHRETGKKVTLWLDEHTLGPLKTLYEAQPGVEAVEMKPGIENWACGGQPWHFGLKTEDLVGREVHHLGFRRFPQLQITNEVKNAASLMLGVSGADLAETPSLTFRVEKPKANRLILHGTGVVVHNKTTPRFWLFLASIRAELEDMFDEIVFVGSPDDRETGLMAYPAWKDFDDGGEVLRTAEYMASSRAMIGCGSSMVALAGQLKIPTIRVHDLIGSVPKVIFSNLGANQINATEAELRKSWPEFKAQHLEAGCPSSKR